jgi:hypothetical protein
MSGEPGFIYGPRPQLILDDFDVARGHIKI